MRYRIDKDPFDKVQPEKEFIKELTIPLHSKKPNNWWCRSPREDEVVFKNVKLNFMFPDNYGLLETIYTDFRHFLKVAEVGDGNYEIITQFKQTQCFEAFGIDITETKCVISAADTEGIRRALIFVEDELYRRGGFLPIGEISRTPLVKSRISRSFFSPHYCPGCEGELIDDNDYYPDEYLNRLMHEGINGLWIQERFCNLLESDIVSEYGATSQQRIKKLNNIIYKCKNYGIKVYILGVEPTSSLVNSSINNHPDMLGQKFLGFMAVCPSTSKGREYIKETIIKLFTLCPDLAGFIDITIGESVASCGADELEEVNCPHCSKEGLKKWQIVLRCEEIMREALDEVKPEAELISWTYDMRSWSPENIKGYLENRRKDVIQMQNFEDLGRPVQLGKERLAYDYWLSYAGPGDLFKQCTEAAVRRHTKLYAKLQVSNSHELASVPYIPVPGILYDKYKYMSENDIDGVVYCWFFGNYPSIMSKAALELSFLPFPENKDEFLLDLAQVYWGSDAKDVVSAWNIFEEGYKNYPVNVAFEWFGPVTDGVVWPLHLNPIDMPLSMSWKTTNMVGGDRIGECLLEGHSLQEAAILCRTMSKKWNDGVAIMDSLSSECKNKSEQKSVAKAISYLFESGANILEFYRLRDELGKLSRGGIDLVNKMEEIVYHEIQVSSELAEICKVDNRLGYHTEADGFEFHYDKLMWRISELKKLLESEFVEIKQRISENKIPLEFYFGLNEESRRYITSNQKEENFVFEDGTVDEKTKISVSDLDDRYVLRISTSKDFENIKIMPEFKLFHPYPTVFLNKDGNIKLSWPQLHSLDSVKTKKEISKWQVERKIISDTYQYNITLNKALFGLEENLPFRMAITKLAEKDSVWEKGDRFYNRLILGHYSPDSYVFIIPKTGDGED